MENDLELQDYKRNCLRDQLHQDQQYKLREKQRTKRITYMKQCIIAGKLIEPKYKIDNNYEIDFIE